MNAVGPGPHEGLALKPILDFGRHANGSGAKAVMDAEFRGTVVGQGTEAGQMKDGKKGCLSITAWDQHVIRTSAADCASQIVVKAPALFPRQAGIGDWQNHVELHVCVE